MSQLRTMRHLREIGRVTGCETCFKSRREAPAKWRLGITYGMNRVLLGHLVHAPIEIPQLFFGGELHGCSARTTSEVAVDIVFCPGTEADRTVFDFSSFEAAV